MEYGNPHYSQILNIMKRQMLFKKVFTATLFCCTLWNTACVNQIEEEDVQEGNIPITFSIKVGSISAKASNNLFEKGDKVGLYAMLTGVSIDKKRYIDNLYLTYGHDNTLIPSKSIFYPEGDNVALDFISYYPYSTQGAAPESATIPIYVQRDQSDHAGYSQSDFLTAQAIEKTSSSDAIELKYQHKLAKIKITLTPGKEEDIDKMQKDDPRIIASGFSTHAEYDFKKGTFNNINEVADIIVSGTWEKDENNKLTGKEFIIIPQPINNQQVLQMEWNGRVYSCPISSLEKLDGNTQYEINITSMQTSSNLLSGVIGTIEEWSSDISMENTDNGGNYAAVHIPVLSFSQSSVYQIYASGKPIAEICKEYLISEKLTSRAIITYPVKKDETTDFSKGTILQLLDTKEAINGGTICWNKDENIFNYTAGNSPAIEKVYFDKDGNTLTDKPEIPMNVNILKYVIRDTRNELQEYPIVKIGTQYWMRNDLCATTYQDGATMLLQTRLGEGAGYFKPAEYDIYFYNGEAVKEQELSPVGWRIPSEKDWNQLKTYLNNNSSLVKAGKWESPNPGKEVTPAENLTGLNILPVGSWSGSSHSLPFKMAGYWTWDAVNKEIPEQTIAFTGDSNEFYMISTKTGKDTAYYKALSIRCIKE